MDLRLEAAALSEIAENTADDPGFRVPQVDWARTGRDVLTLEWVDGIRIDDVDALKAAGHDLEQLAADVIQSFLRHALRDGFFHADMHPGNLFVDAGGDHRRRRLRHRRPARQEGAPLPRRDPLRLHHPRLHARGRGPFRGGLRVPPSRSCDFAQAIRAIGEPIHGQPAETISMAQLLTLLFEVTDLFDMQTRRN